MGVSTLPNPATSNVYVLHWKGSFKYKIQILVFHIEYIDPYIIIREHYEKPIQYPKQMVGFNRLRVLCRNRWFAFIIFSVKYKVTQRTRRAVSQNHANTHTHTYRNTHLAHTSHYINARESSLRSVKQNIFVLKTGNSVLLLRAF